MIEDKLFQKSLEYVLRTPKTERQVRTWLFTVIARRHEMATKQSRPPEYIPVDAIINKLKDLGYINDADYAVRFAEAKSTKYGMRNIKAKLTVKGVAREHIDELATPDQTDLARSLAQKYMRNKDFDQKTFQKLYRFLLSKGLNYDIINHILDEFKGDPR